MPKWTLINKAADFNAIAKELNIDPVCARLIRNRDYVTFEEVRRFLTDTLCDIPDSHLLKDIDQAVSILKYKIEHNARVRIIGDYDIDGICATHILKAGLSKAGLDADAIIPERVKDGYGLNVSLLKSAQNDLIDTIITCDNGIAAINEIALAKAFSITVIVTDHHEVPLKEDGSQIVPPADAVINPKQSDCKYPYKEICGAVVALKLIDALWKELGIAENAVDEFLEFAAMASVGDIMPLRGENRILVKYGIKKMQATKNVGLLALLKACGLEGKALSAYHMGFVIGPCLNAAGRLETAAMSLELFCETDIKKCEIAAARLVELNEERKRLTKEGVDLAFKKIEESDELLKDRVLVIYLPHTHESLAGIIAGRVREAYNKPCFIVTDSLDIGKGSGRSIETYSMYEEMCKCKELFIKFGGHKMAAGLSLNKEDIEKFRKKINEVCTLSDDDLEKRLRIDLKLPLSYLTVALVRQFDLLMPFGKDNERPLFAAAGAKIDRCLFRGDKKNVFKAMLTDSSGVSLPIISFNNRDGIKKLLMGISDEDSIKKFLEGGGEIIANVAFRPKVNEYLGNCTLELELEGFS